MNTFKVLFFSILTAMTFLLVGCGGASSSGTDSTRGQVATIILPVTTKEVTTNSQAFDIVVKVIDDKHAPYSTGKVVIDYPDDYDKGRGDIGSFAPSTGSITNGEATFSYTAPSDLDANTSDITFGFHHDSNSGEIVRYTVTINPGIATVTSGITLVLPVKTPREVTTNSQAFDIVVTVLDKDNRLYSTGTVALVYPSDVRAGRDIGSFTPSTASITNGEATFSYTAPSNLDANTSDIKFGFYHDSNPSEILIYTVTINPDANQTVMKNYILTSDQSTDVTMALESSKNITFSVSDDASVQVNHSNMTSLMVTSLNPNIGTLADISGNTGNSLTVTSKNNVLISVNSTKISGLIPLEVVANFSDVNGDAQTLTKTFNILVLSGPPSAMSLSYVSTSQVLGSAKFIDKWVLTVTDKYSNRVDSNPAVSMGMLAGYTKASPLTATNSANYLYFPNGGTLATNSSFTAPSDVFGNVDTTNDILVTFGAGHTYNASGKWDISDKISNILYLADTYDGNDTSGLGFAVGHNYRQDTCNPGVEWVANVYSENNNPIIDETGSMAISIEYDYYLAGKSPVLWVNLVGQNYGTNQTVKIGEARKVTLRSLGLSADSESYGAGFTGIKRILIRVKETTEYYYNSNFGSFNVEGPADLSWEIVGTSMDNGITSCTDEMGVAYVDVNITSAPTAGAITLSNVLPANEF